MKKAIISLLLIAMFIFSIGAAYAHAQDGDRRGADDAEDTTDDTNDDANDNVDIGGSDNFGACRQLYWHDNTNTACDQKEFCGAYMYLGLRTFENQNECQESVQEMAQTRQQTQDRINEISERNKEMIANAREKLQTARENLEKARQRFDTAKQSFQERKQALVQCQDQETEECMQTREQIRTDAQNYLETISDRILQNQEKLMASVEASEDLTDEQKAQMTQRIQQRIQEVEATKTMAQNAGTKQEVIDAGKQMKNEWKSMYKEMKVNAGEVINAKLGNIAARADHLSERLDAKVASMKEKGLDTAQTEALVAEFKASVEAAKAHYVSTQAKFAGAKASTDPSNGLIKEAMDEMNLAKQDLKDAYAKVKEILKAIRAAGDTEPIAEVTTTTEAAV